MGQKMIDPDQRFPVGKGKSFGKIHSDQQSRHQSWCMRHSHCIDRFHCDPGGVQRFGTYFFYCGKMFACCKFRNYTAVNRMFRHLGGDCIGADDPSVFDYRSRGLVAAAFDSQHQCHKLFLFLPEIFFLSFKIADKCKKIK